MDSDGMEMITNIKTEPEEYIDDEAMEEAAERLINLDQMEQLVVDPEELGVLGNMMKSYDSMANNDSGSIEFLMGDSKHSFVVTVKRVDQSSKHSSPSKLSASSSGVKNVVHVNRPSKDEIETIGETGSILKIENVNDMHNYFKSSVSDDKVENCSIEDDDDRDDESSIIRRMIEESATVTIEEGNGYISPTDETSDNENETTETEKIYTCSHCQFTTPIKEKLFRHLMDHSQDVLISAENYVEYDDINPEESPPQSDTDVPKKRKVQTNKRSWSNEKKTKSAQSPKTKSKKPTVKLLVEDDDVLAENVLLKKIKSEVYQCSLCEFKCTDQTKYYRHIGLVHTNDGSTSTAAAADAAMTHCELCSYKGKNRRRLSSHMRTTHGMGPKYTCEHCSYSTSHLPNFNRHVKIVHEKLKPVKCDQCDFVTSRNYLLQKHVMYRHQGIKPYQCSECSFASTSSSACKAHITEIHRGERPYKCAEEECTFATSRRFVLKNHLRSAHRKDLTGRKDAAFACPFCSHVSSQKGNLSRHIKVRHTNEKERYKCGECDFTSSQKYYVEIHITEVHKGEFPYSCDLCEFKSSVKQRFERHFQAVHLGQKPHECQFCDYKASQKVHMNRHIEVIHMGEKPHVCVYCQFQTGHRGNLKAHLKAIHKIEQEMLTEELRKCADLRKQNIVIVSQSAEEQNCEQIEVEEQEQ